MRSLVFWVNCMVDLFYYPLMVVLDDALKKVLI